MEVGGGAVSSSAIDVLSCWTSILRLCRSIDVVPIEPSPTKYCITGIFPGTFISRKMMNSAFSRFLFSRPTYGCTDIKFGDNATKHFACWTCRLRNYNWSNQANHASSIEQAWLAQLFFTLIALRAAFHQRGPVRGQVCEWLWVLQTCITR